MEGGQKRKAEADGPDDRDKRVKTKKQWRVPRKNDRGAVQAKAIKPGNSGIWATCVRGKEGKCVGELRDLFTEYAELLYGDALGQAAGGHEEGDDEGDDDIEGQIQAEVAGIRKPASVQLFTNVKVEVPCVVFFKTEPPVEPVSFVKRICEDASKHSALKRTRFVQRLSPMTMIGHATPDSLEKLALEVLAPHFNQVPFVAKKFAIRPTIRNHNVMKRTPLIEHIAALVGQFGPHKVSLNEYDLLIIVEIYQNICGVSVVDNTTGSSFEQLKRFNLAEIFDPSPKSEVPVLNDAEPARLTPHETTASAHAPEAKSPMDLS
ncbi:THUMP protein [Teratosphaeria destructans]|uniref:THUMP protein n=1 Tax=Teratosphaeria destructans TaxID=418781 RepID=A0A9W7SZX1_9PEZI|nr:THUMP protein [Teratosphaeria destructans]